MRAIVLLCLLHAAFGENRYSWSGPARAEVPAETDEVDACLQSPSHCGCCLMLQETNRMRTAFNGRLNELEQLHSQTIQSFNIIQASRTAVSVALYSGGMKCIGPFGMKHTVIYEQVFINLGNGYDENTGIFTATHSGVYSLILTVYSDSGSSNSPLAACAGLEINSQVVAGSQDRNYHDHEDSSTVAVAVHLGAGDTVSVSLPAGCFLCDDENHYNTFSVFLLYPA